MIESDRAQLLAQAQAELHAARTLIADPLAGPRVAAPHLWRLWQLLGGLSRAAQPTALGASLADHLAPAHLELVPARVREGLWASLQTAYAHSHAQATSASATPSFSRPRVLLSELRALASVLRAIEREVGGRSLARQRALRWAARASLGLVGVSLLLALAWRPWQADIGPWRAAYYPSKVFEGRPDIRRERDVAFDWGEHPATDSIPSDFYSARFDSCLLVDEAGEVAFMLVSDNGSRLFVDGELRIDNWAGRPYVAVAGASVPLAPGVHHLRVEYFEDRGEAKLHLRASFEAGVPPEPIPAERLVFPGEALDDACPRGQ